MGNFLSFWNLELFIMSFKSLKKLTNCNAKVLLIFLTFAIIFIQAC